MIYAVVYPSFPFLNELLSELIAMRKFWLSLTACTVSSTWPDGYFVQHLRITFHCKYAKALDTKKRKKIARIYIRWVSE